MKGTRADVRLVELGLCQSREKARSLIMSGAVYINEVRIDKAGDAVPESLWTKTPLRVPLTTRTPNASVGASAFSSSVSALKKPVSFDSEYVCAALAFHWFVET